MRVEQVMFRSGAVRRAGDFYFPDGADGIAPAIPQHHHRAAPGPGRCG